MKDPPAAEKVAAPAKKRSKQQEAIDSLGLTFWQTTGQNAPLYRAVMDMVFGDLIAAKLMQSASFCGDDALQLARTYQVVASADRERLDEQSHIALARAQGNKSDGVLRQNAQQLAVELAYEITADVANAKDGAWEQDRDGHEGFRTRRMLTRPEFHAVSAAADMLAKLPPIPLRSWEKPEEVCEHYDLIAKVKNDARTFAVDRDDTGVFEDRPQVEEWAYRLTEVEQESLLPFLIHGVLPGLDTDDPATIADMIAGNNGSIDNVVREHFQFRAARRNLCLKLFRFVMLVQTDDTRRDGFPIGATRYYDREDVRRGLGSVLTPEALADQVAQSRAGTYPEEQFIRSLRNGFVVPVASDEADFARGCFVQPRDWSFDGYVAMQQDDHSEHRAFYEEVRRFINDPATWATINAPAIDMRPVAAKVSDEGVKVVWTEADRKERFGKDGEKA